MNITFSLILLIIFLLPGLVFRRYYFSEEFSKEYFKSRFFEVFLSSIIPSLILHTIWIYLTEFFGYKVNFRILSDIFSSSPENFSHNIDIYKNQILLYNSTILVASIGIGLLSKYIIRKLRLDLKYKIFRFQNSWHYLFNGEFFKFPRANYFLQKDTYEAIELIYVDILTDSNSGTIIYDGVLVDYELSRNGSLESVTLQNVGRFHLNENGEETRVVKIHGHILSIPYKEIKNINIAFYKLTTEDNETYEISLVE